MTTLSFQIHVLKNQQWEVLKSFGPSERSLAWNMFTGLSQARGFAGKKFIEEAVKDNGLMFANTISFQIFNPDPAGGASSKRGKTKARHGPGGSATGRRWRRPGRQRSGDGASVVTSLFGFIRRHGARFLGGGNGAPVPNTRPLSEHGDAERIRAHNARLTPGSDAYSTRYGDEDGLSTGDLVRAESVEVLGEAFLTFIAHNLVTDALRQDPRFHIGICCFTVGALIRIEQEFAMDSERGQALLAEALGIFLLDETAVDAFMTRMTAVLAQPASARFIKAGAKCFALYEKGAISQLKTQFAKTFEGIAPDAAPLGDGTRTGVMLVQIDDPIGLREDYGTVGMQAVLDHLLSALTRLAPQHGGRPLKMLGDGILVVADRPEGLVWIAVTLVDYVADGDPPRGVPPYAVRIGTHFDGGVARNGDVFGAVVQVAASLADSASPGEACLSSDLESAIAAGGGKIVRRTKPRFQGLKPSANILHVT
jgi:hypothetical protein